MNKKKKWFLKLKWLFHQTNIIKHQIISLYGKYLNKLIKKKIILDLNFFYALSFLELRLSTLVLRMFGVLNFLIVNKAILSGKVLVNSHTKHPNFLVRIGSVIKFFYKPTVFLLTKGNLVSVSWWRFNSWQKWNVYLLTERLNQQKRKFRLFKKLKFNLIINYLEVFSRIKTGIVLFKPTLGEIVLNNKKRMLCLRLVKSKN